ncbi:MAG: hypothetical protein QUV05_02375 [Phycisphaerae bacterium]|nr:hypothetical protein [Phycisphaerae bacterium]
MLKRLYHLLALVAMINLFAVAGLIGYLFASGRLNAERVEQMAVVLRGEFPTSQPAVASSRPAERDRNAQPSGEEIVRRQEMKELLALKDSRRARELRDRDLLDKRIQLETRQLIEKLERKENELKQQKQILEKEGEQAGFDRQLNLLSKTEPKLAMQLLKNQIKEPDAVQLLMKMDENRVKAIINACKTEEDRAWIGRILNQIGKYGNSTAAGVDGSGGPASDGG